MDHYQDVKPMGQVPENIVDFGIIAPLPVELDAILEQLGNYSRLTYEQADHRTYYHATIMTETGCNYQVVITLLPHMGNLDSALATQDMLRLWHPRYVLVVGIAGGTRPEEQEIGDILIGESIFYYELGKIKPKEIQKRPRILPSDPLLYDRAMNFVFRSSDWTFRIPEKIIAQYSENKKPKIHFGLIASGEKVYANILAIKELAAYQPVIGVEMESAGVASAAIGSINKTGFLAIRGICDFGDEKKDDKWHSFAAYTAAAWAFAFLASEPVSCQETRNSLTPIATPATSSVDRVGLYEEIRRHIDNEDFKTLCFILGVDVDEIPGEKKSSKVRELIMYFDRRGELINLSRIWAKYKGVG